MAWTINHVSQEYVGSNRAFSWIVSFTGWAVAQTCCISQCAKYRKTGKFDYPWEQNPESIVTKLGLNNYVGYPTLTAKYGSDGSTWVVWSMREISLFVTFFSFFRYFITRAGWHAWPMLTIYTSICAFSRKEVPFGALDYKNLYLLPFLPQNTKICITAYGDSNGYNSDIFKDRRKVFAPNGGFSGSANLMASLKFLPDQPLLPW